MSTDKTDVSGHRCVVARHAGDSSVLELQSLQPPEPGPGELLVRHTAIGVNFIDIYFRSGLYPWPVEQDLILGSEAAGVVDAVGPDINGFAVGDRVGYTIVNGAYATHRKVAANHVVKLPLDITDDIAAATMLKGLTASYLINDSYKVSPGESVLFHAAAGGVGLIAGQWLKARGVTVIGTAGGENKCDLARQHGYDHVIDYSSENFVSRVKEITNGEGVHAVYDSVGKDTVAASMQCLRRFGTLVCFGQSSGPVTDFSISDLAAGSFRLTRPILFHFFDKPGWLADSATELFDLVGSQTLKITINQRFGLNDVAQAHRSLESRQTTGSTILQV